MILTLDQIDVWQELINIGVGEATSTLNQMLNSQIHLQVPSLSILSLQEARQKLSREIGNAQVSAVKLDFSGPFTGIIQVVFPTDSAAKLVTVMLLERPEFDDLEALKIGTLIEVGNILVNCVVSTISNQLEQSFQYSLPVYLEETLDSILPADEFEDSDLVLLAKARFSTGKIFIFAYIYIYIYIYIYAKYPGLRYGYKQRAPTYKYIYT
ncbi:MAG: chemotaxis protein CheC [Oscillatoria princeps RMCB-10]|jgi:chemotaxis protein CheC|nr:chemotaxis protein CheC [Oscillatoria princeps RMCB-10]